MPKKTQRGMLGNSLVGLGLALVSAMAFRHLRPPVPTERGNQTALATREPITAGRAVPRDALQPKVPPLPRTDVPPPELASTPFLRDLTSALKSIEGGQDPEQKQEKLETLATRIPAAELSAVVSFLQEPDRSELQQDLGLRLIRRWTAADPLAVSDWINQRPAGTVSQDAIKEVATVWANQNLAEAAQWARRLAEGVDRQSGLMNVAYEAARTKPVEAITLAMEMTPDQARDDLITHSAMQWGAADPSGAAKWASQIESEGLRDRILSGIAAGWGETDPAAAASLAVKSIPPGKAQDDAVVGIVQRWAQKEPENAAAWVAQFPEGRLRDTALDNLIRLWADQDFTKVGTWLNGAALGASQDMAIGTFVSKISPSFPETAAHWAEAIEDDAIRVREIERVGEAWMLSDAKSARGWIAEGELPQTTKQRLLALGSQ